MTASAHDLTHRANALVSYGDSLRTQQRPREALQSYMQALQLNPRCAPALLSVGKILLEARQLGLALQSFDQYIALDSRSAEAHRERGQVLMELQRPREAVQSYERALEIDSRCVLSLFRRSVAFVQLGDHEATAKSFARLLEVAPDYPFALGGLLWSKLMLCDWSGWNEIAARIGAPGSDPTAAIPFTLLTVTASAPRQLECARAYTSGYYPPSLKPLWNGERYGHRKIRVAYLSPDFGSHPVSGLLVRLFETHDRERFETLAISLAPEEASSFGRRVKGAFDTFIDASRMGDAAVAALIREREVDILVDIVGYTTGSRTGILAHRPAPVQVNYLGFPGTLGAPYIDYILADDFVIPADSRQHYAEKVVWLPGCFQANDSERIRSSEAGAALRGQHGLPESGLVFCCFNNTYKINPQSFDSWMRILQAVPGSVLWLLADEEAAQANLRREALQRGVEPERLVFAKRASYAEHLARLPCADLFLDTLPFNAGTTASDALWSGVPVLTCCGEALAARMAGSLLRAMSLPELITYNMQDYEAAAIRLGSTPELLAETRARVDQQRSTSTVFDTEHFRRHVEQAYVSMWERSEQGQPPENFACSL